MKMLAIIADCGINSLSQVALPNLAMGSLIFYI